MFSYNQVYETTLDYFNGDELATDVWIKKYALHDGDEYYEKTPDAMHRRMAREFARIETTNKSDKLSKYGQIRKPLTKKKIYELFRNFEKVIPQGSVMASLGNKYTTASLSNCVVLPELYDSYNSIMYTDTQLTALYRRRCGVGFDISPLRPKDSKVSNAAASSTGAVSFMERFSNTTREVAQFGRRGAGMITIDCRHPDVEDFIKIKQDLSKVTGANVSIRWTDDFLEAVENDEEYTLRWPVDFDTPQYTKTVKAKEVWDKMVKSAWGTAEPGIAFKDRIEYYSTCHNYPDFNITSSNPCSEIFMGGPGGDSCRLISINLFHAVKNPYTPEACLDKQLLYKITYEAQRLMDNLVDLELESVVKIIEKVESDPEPDYIKEIELRTWKDLYESGKRGRRTGLGFTALGDTLAALGVRYGSEESLEVVKEIMQTKFRGEWDSSIDMAIERGTFPAFDPEIEKTHGFWHEIKDEFPDIYERNMKYGRRNISISTVAPTGSLSLLAKLVNRFGTSSGIEPAYALSFMRRKKINPGDPNTRVDYVDDLGDSWQHFEVQHSGLKEWQDISGVNSPYQDATAEELDWKNRVRLQAVVQRYTTHSISSTLNLPNDTTVEDVDIIYREAKAQGLKGTTVYRAGCRSGVLVKEDRASPKRPKELHCLINNTSVKGKNWVVLVGFLGEKPYEVFAFENGRIKYKEGTLVKQGNGRYDLVCNEKEILYDITSTYNTDEEQALTRLISLALRHGVELKFICEQLAKSGGTINSFSKAINRTLTKNVPQYEARCPDCGSKLVFIEGCSTCSCGYSGCS